MVGAKLVSLLLFSTVLQASHALGVADRALQRCAVHCTCKGTEQQLLPIAGAAVSKCLARAKPVDLERVVVAGDIDLSTLPSTHLTPRNPLAIAGLHKPIEQLGLERLEQELGIRVTGAVVVQAPIRIHKSVIQGRLIGPGKQTGGHFRGPSVFLAPVAITETVFRERVDLSRSIFRAPVRFDASAFEKEVSFHHARFDANAFFQGVTASSDTSFANTRFLGEAVFAELQIRDGGQVDFSRTRFHRGAAFHGRRTRPTVLRQAEFAEAVLSGGEADFRYAHIHNGNFAKISSEGTARFDHAQFWSNEGPTSFQKAHLGSGAVFDDARFHAPVTFFGANFAGKRRVSFDRAVFTQKVHFDQAMFSGPLSLIGARAANVVSFTDAETRGPLDVRHAIISALDFGGSAARAHIGGDALFDHADIGYAMLDNTAFAARASFVSATFGRSPACPATSGPVLSLSNVLFADTADFSDAMFFGDINLAHLSAESGKMKWRWEQLEPRLVTSLGARLTDAGPPQGCFRIDVASPTTTQQVQRARKLKADALRWIERNFRAQDLSGDAARVGYAKAWTEAEHSYSESGSWLGRAMQGLIWAGWGWLAGFGLRPGQIFLETLAVLAAFAFVYFLSRREMATDAQLESTLDWKSVALPWKPTSPFVRTTDSRAALAIWVSLAALTPVRVKGAYMVLHEGDGFRWVLLFERLAGYLLLWVLAVSLANTMPVLHKLLGWLPGF